MKCRFLVSENLILLSTLRINHEMACFYPIYFKPIFPS